MQVNEILYFQNLMILNDYLIVSEDSFSQFVGSGGSDNSFLVTLKAQCMIMLLLMWSGNVQLSPGHVPSDIKSRTGLGFVHLNIRSLVPTVHMIKCRNGPI